MWKSCFLFFVLSFSVLFAQSGKTETTVSKFPITIKQAVDSLMIIVDTKSKEEIKAMKKKDLIKLHFEFGMWIRNNFGLWKGNNALREECGDSLHQKQIHPDDASMFIIEKFWERLQVTTFDGEGLPPERKDSSGPKSD